MNGIDTTAFAVTVWKDGTWKVWAKESAVYARSDSDWLCEMSLQEILAEPCEAHVSDRPTYSE
jgi:hypothetical protein